MNPRKIISILYSILFLTVPLVLWPYTSELFEFNKMVVTYILTLSIVFVWVIRSIVEKKIVFKRTPLDTFILLFLLSQTLSTVVSLDIRTSLFGYYGRFNGGLLSLITYSLLYWGYVSNMDTRDVGTHLKAILGATFLASFYGILERLGIDKDIWIQDVQNRIFSTFGQPNWMAAWLAAVIPVSLSLGLNSSLSRNLHFDDSLIKNPAAGFTSYLLNIKNYVSKNKWLFYLLITQIFFISLLFTKSRSGILGFGVANVVFWGSIFFSEFVIKRKFVDPKKTTERKGLFLFFVICTLAFGLIVLLSGSPWSPSLREVFVSQNSKTETDKLPAMNASAPLLEVGGSSSIEIRKIVWKGALDVWRAYPLLGSGVETFAFSYYEKRPVEHNMVSEWDFLYNKAHNEYLNYLATTGSVGILTYTILIIFMLITFIKALNFKYETRNPDSFTETKNRSFGNNSLFNYSGSGFRILNIGLLAGYMSILFTNFFGFSVVPINLLFYLYPAMGIVLERESRRVEEFKYKHTGLSNAQKVGVFISCSFTLLLFYSICRYWYADILYNRAVMYSGEGRLVDKNKAISSAIKFSSKEAIFHSELADTYCDMALIYLSQENSETSETFAGMAISSINKAESLSPRNLNIIRNKARILISLSSIKPALILDAKKTLLKAVSLAPTEAKLVYNLGLTHYRIGELDEAKIILEKTIEMKSNYKDARYAYSILLAETGDIAGAKEQLTYILEKIDSTNTEAQKMLEQLNTSENQLQIE